MLIFGTDNNMLYHNCRQMTACVQCIIIIIIIIIIIMNFD